MLRWFQGDIDQLAELCPLRSSLSFIFLSILMLLFKEVTYFIFFPSLLILVSDEELKRRVAEELALEQAKKESENQKR